jgi:hypothetical protein
MAMKDFSVKHELCNIYGDKITIKCNIYGDNLKIFCLKKGYVHALFSIKKAVSICEISEK